MKSSSLSQTTFVTIVLSHLYHFLRKCHPHYRLTKLNLQCLKNIIVVSRHLHGCLSQCHLRHRLANRNLRHCLKSLHHSPLKLSIIPALKGVFIVVLHIIFIIVSHNVTFVIVSRIILVFVSRVIFIAVSRVIFINFRMWPSRQKLHDKPHFLINKEYKRIKRWV